MGGFNEERKMLFSTVLLSSLTVFRCVNGDCSMSNGTPLVVWFCHAYGALFVLPYVACIIVVTYGMLNLVMALFVDSTLRLSVEKAEQSFAGLVGSAVVRTQR